MPQPHHLWPPPRGVVVAAPAQTPEVAAGDAAVDGVFTPAAAVSESSDSSICPVSYCADLIVDAAMLVTTVVVPVAVRVLAAAKVRRDVPLPCPDVGSGGGGGLRLPPPAGGDQRATVTATVYAPSDA